MSIVNKMSVRIFVLALVILAMAPSIFGKDYAFQSEQPVPSTRFDFDGDLKADIAVWRPTTGTWYRLNSSDGTFFAYHFGLPGDVPQAADFDGDGKTDLATFRPSTGVWYLQQSAAGFSSFRFGMTGDTPVAGDYDGDGKSDAAVYRSSTGIWYLLQSTDGFKSVQFGITTDSPVPGDGADGVPDGDVRGFDGASA